MTGENNRGWSRTRFARYKRINGPSLALDLTCEYVDSVGASTFLTAGYEEQC